VEGSLQMKETRTAFLAAAGSAVALLSDRAIAASWDQPSALAKLDVSGLAGHLARQILTVPLVLAADKPQENPVSLADHYARARWRDADLDDESNVAIRRDSEREAADGPAALAARAAAELEQLRRALPAEPDGRVVHLPWGPWSLSLDDFLVTRLMEIAVHSDDLAHSCGIPTPELPPEVLDPVLALLVRLAMHRHGPTAVLRAFSRAERAPATIAAF
jgi:Mycothiol maleylpyruvate isomerase N-terminal domain